MLIIGISIISSDILKSCAQNRIWKPSIKNIIAEI